MRSIKIALYILGSFLVCSGSMFKIQHYPFATIQIVLGLAIFLTAILLKDRKNKKDNSVLDN